MNDARLEMRLPIVMREQIEEHAARRGWSAAMYAREAIRLALLEESSPCPHCRPDG